MPSCGLKAVWVGSEKLPADHDPLEKKKSANEEPVQAEAKENPGEENKEEGKEEAQEETEEQRIKREEEEKRAHDIGMFG